jgi:hypothetical protein
MKEMGRGWGRVDLMWDKINKYCNSNRHKKSTKLKVAIITLTQHPHTSTGRRLGQAEVRGSTVVNRGGALPRSLGSLPPRRKAGAVEGALLAVHTCVALRGEWGRDKQE